MEIVLKNSKGLERFFDCIVSQNELNQALAAFVQRDAKNVQLPGFRKGKVPLDKIRSMSGDKHDKEVVDYFVKQSINQIVSEKHIDYYYGQPEVMNCEFNDNNNLVVTVRFYSLPEIELQDTSKLNLNKYSFVESEVDLDTYMLFLSDNEEVISKTDCAIDYTNQAKFSGKYIVDGKESVLEEKLHIDFTEQNIFKEITDACIGKKTGDDVFFELKYDKNMPNKDLAGKKVKYFLQVSEVLSTCNNVTLDIIANNIQKSPEETKELVLKDAKTHFEKLIHLLNKKNVMEAIKKEYSTVEIDIPIQLVEQEKNNLINIINSDEAISEENKRDDTAVFEMAKDRIKSSIFLSCIGKENKIEASQEDVMRHFRDLLSTTDKNVSADFNLGLIARVSAYEEKIVEYILSTSIVNNKDMKSDEIYKEFKKYMDTFDKI